MFNFIIYLLCVDLVLSANILGVFIIPAVSHQTVFHPILSELSLRGHQVTVITPHPLRDSSLTNLTEIDVSFVQDYFNQLSGPYYLEIKKVSPWFLATFNTLALSWVIQTEFEHPSVQALINDASKQFDLVLVEFLHPLPVAFSGKFNCPVVGLLSQSANVNQHFALGNPSHPIVIPEILLRNGDEPLSFFKRLESVVYSSFMVFLYKFVSLPIENRVAKRIFGNNIPYLGDLERNLSALLMNIHPLTHGVRPNLPNVIELGKIKRYDANRTIPEDMLNFMQSAKEGVVYFSLGSLMKATILGNKSTNIIKEVFSELPQKFLWKWESEYLDGMPDNVKVKKWMPQMEILQHPNVKVFITQSGPQSIEEALTAKVPLLAIPLQFDQFSLAKRIESYGLGRQLDVDNITKENFKEALLDVINNHRYKEQITKFNNLIEDQPMDGLELAIWWIEYVIRHKGAAHLRSPLLDIPFYEYYFLDVIAITFLVILIIIWTIFQIFCLLFKFYYVIRGNKRIIQHN